MPAIPLGKHQHRHIMLRTCFAYFEAGYYIDEFIYYGAVDIPTSENRTCYLRKLHLLVLILN